MNSDLQSKVFQAGVIGCGGAGFPTHIKLHGSYEYVIANGAECEPLLQCDQQVMIHFAAAVVQGLESVIKATNARKGFLAFKKKHTRLYSSFQQILKSSPADIDVSTLGDFYPVGDEQILVYELSGRIVPEGGRPADVGCLVQNVQTLVNVAAAMDGKPVTERILSVHGEIRTPATLRVPIGTPVCDIFEACDGIMIDNPVILAGGAMMGMIIPADFHIGKTTSGLYVLPEKHPLVQIKNDPIERTLKVAKFACEQCSFCTMFCPRFLLGHDLFPHKIMQAVAWDSTPKPDVIQSVFLCCECGLCGALFACPARLSPDRYNSLLKKQMRQASIPAVHNNTPAAVRPDRNGRRISTASLIQRLALKKYEKNSPYNSRVIQPERVRINVAEHIGTPAKPLVKIGDTVARGKIIAQTPVDSQGTTYHASISGTVTAINDRFIQIDVRG